MLVKMKKTIATIVSILIVLSLISPVYAQEKSIIDQKYDVVIVRGDLPADLIIAQVYTQKEELPLIAITESGINDALKTELQGYRAQGYENVLIIGGEEAISREIESILEVIGFEITRLWDWNRYGTSARVAINLWGKSDTVVVTQGDKQGRLLSAERVAIDYQAPLLLTETSVLPEQTKQAIQILGANRIVLIGDVDESVRRELNQLGGLEETQIRQIILEEPPKDTSFFVIGLIIGGLAAAVLSVLFGSNLIKKQEEIPYNILTDDEQVIIDIIIKEGGSMKQQNLPKLTSFSRPKVSRSVSGLIEREILIKEKKGKTFILKLQKTFKMND